MAMQEFLASYAVEVDEEGLRRLQEALEGNREKAEAAASAFLAAKAAMDQLFSGEEGQLPEIKPENGSEITLAPILDLTGAEDALNQFKARMEALRPKLRVNPTGITSAVSSAISSVRSMLASVSVQVPVKAVAQLDTGSLPTQVSIPGTITASGSGNTGSTGNTGNTGNSGNMGNTGSTVRTGSTGGTAATGQSTPRSRTASSPSGLGGNQLQAYGEGGRVEKPTLAMIAEEGDPEYVIPMGREDRAVPQLREVLREISSSARAVVLEGTGSMEPAQPLQSVQLPNLQSLSADLRDMTNTARTAALPPVIRTGDSSRSVEAPVTIQVSSSSVAPEEIGQYVYDLAQRHLLRTIQGVFS